MKKEQSWLNDPVASFCQSTEHNVDDSYPKQSPLKFMNVVRGIEEYQDTDKTETAELPANKQSHDSFKKSIVNVPSNANAK